MSCCTYSVFMDDFNHYFPQYFDVPPSAQQLKMARSDWRTGNTGYEAAPTTVTSEACAPRVMTL